MATQKGKTASDNKHSRIYKGWTMTGQRCCGRVAFFCPVKLTLLPDGPTISANSFDISMGGIGLIAPVFIERGKNVRVQFCVKKNKTNTHTNSRWGEWRTRAPRWRETGWVSISRNTSMNRLNRN